MLLFSLVFRAARAGHRFLYATSANAPDAPADDRPWPDATLVARHEQRLFGALVVEHAYVFRPLR